MDDASLASVTFWREVRWCDQRLSRYQRRLLVQAWLPTLLGERIPWQPVLPLMVAEAQDLCRVPFALLECFPGYRDAFRPTQRGTMVIWLQLVGHIPALLRPRLQVVGAPVAPPSQRRQRRSRWGCPR